MAERNFLVPAAIIAAGAIIAGAVVYVGRSGAPAPLPAAQGRDAALAAGAVTGELADDDPSLGSPSAPVTIVEFSDFQCPFCRRFFRDTLLRLKDEYVKTGKARFVYRDFPLTAIHEMAETYAQAAECAEDQGRFWEMHDKIFQEQDLRGQGTISGISVPDLKRWAREVGLDGTAFDGCVDSGKYREEVAKDLADGQAAGVTGTPTVFVNGRAVVGAVPYAQFKALIDAELAK